MHGWSSIYREKGSVGELSRKLFWNVYIWHVLGGLIFYGLWTSLPVLSPFGPEYVTNVQHFWSHTFITHVNTGNIVMWKNTAQHCKSGLFRDSDFVGDSEDPKSTSGGILCIFGSHTFAPISWMCKSFLSAGSRMDGIPALDLWEWVIEVIIHSLPNQTNKTKAVREPRRNLSATLQSNMRKQIPTTHSNLDLNNIDHVPSSGTHSGFNVMLYVFEDNEAVIKMIIKGRSPTMRRVSRTHRVALDWLFDRINLVSKIQIRYIDTKHQLADILTKENFTRDEWNNLLHLFNISHYHSTCCAENSSLKSCSKTMAKRMQEQKGEIYSDVLVFSCSDKFLIREKSDCIQKSGDTHSDKETRKQDEKKFEIRRSVEFSSAFERCILWWANGHSHGETCRYKRGIRGSFRIWNWEWRRWREKPCASSKSDCHVETKSWKDIMVTQSTSVSPATIHHAETVFSIVREMYGRENDLDVNMANWCTFLNATLRAVHHGQDYEANLRYVKNNLWKSVGQLFNETGQLISEQKEITGISTINLI